MKFRNGGVFTVTLRLTAVDAVPLVQRIDARLDQIYDATRSLNMSCPYDPENGDTPYLFTFSSQARTTDILGRATKHAPGIWDSKGRKWPKFHKIELGSAVRVSYGFNHDYRADSPGVSPELLSVQTAGQ